LFWAEAKKWEAVGERFEAYRNVRIALGLPKETLLEIWMQNDAPIPDEAADKRVQEAMHQAEAIRDEWHYVFEQLRARKGEKSL
jgi:hypothetical protein